jgi:plastocyanin
MNKTLLVSLLALAFPIALLAHGGVDDDKLIIRMTDNGFEPKELTVTEGDKVLFINNDDVDRWPASNLHPTHGLYPEFDPLKGIKPGDSWTMTFDKAGNWRMHDHLIPHMTGTIVVLKDETGNATSTAAKEKNDELKAPAIQSLWGKIRSFFARMFRFSGESASSSDTKSLGEFRSLPDKAKYAWLENIASSDDPKVAWEYLLKAYSGPRGTDPKAHDMAHLVGQLIFNEYGLDGLSICTPVFAFGCYHGLMAVAFEGKSLPEYKESISGADKGCLRLGGAEDASYWSCVHGIGHGIITYREHDTDIALKDCDALGERVRTYCHDGVFMELSISGTKEAYRESDPLFPCDAIDAGYQSACARAQASVMRSRFGLDTTDIAGICRKSTETIHYHCIESLGYHAAQIGVGVAKRIVTECESIANGDDQAQCKAAAAGELVFQDMEGWRGEAPKICQSMNANYLSACLGRIETVKESYGRN